MGTLNVNKLVPTSGNFTLDGAIILANAESLGTQSTTMQISNNAGNLYYFSKASATFVASVSGTWLAVGNNNGAGLWYRIA